MDAGFVWYLEFEGKTRIISLNSVIDSQEIHQEIIDSQNYSFKRSVTDMCACWFDTGWRNTFEEALDDANDNSPKLMEKYADIINPLVKKHHLETMGCKLEDMFWDLEDPNVYKNTTTLHSLMRNSGLNYFLPFKKDVNMFAFFAL